MEAPSCRTPALATPSPCGSRPRPSAHATAALTTAVSSAGGALTALDVAESHADRIVVDVTCDASDVDHADRITEAIAQVPAA